VCHAGWVPVLERVASGNLLLGVTGSVACKDVPEQLSSIRELSPDRVWILMSARAATFITPADVTSMCGVRALATWPDTGARPIHLELAAWADAMVIAPVTANTIAKLAAGLADSLLLSVVLAASCPIAIAPAMNERMWRQPTVQRNLRQLRLDGYIIAGEDDAVLSIRPQPPWEMRLLADILRTLDAQMPRALP